MPGFFMRMNALEQIKRHEGFESKPYRCSAGKQTLGYGRNLEAVSFSSRELELLGRTSFDNKPLTEEEGEMLLAHDLDRILMQICSFSFWQQLNGPRQAVVLNMCFNLGVSGFLKFKRTIDYIEAGCYQAASVEMLDSKWAREDVAQWRSTELASQMYLGEWHELV